MKFRTTAIALAVAGIVAAPMAAQAEIGAYASVRTGLLSTDDGTNDSIDFASGNRGSRIGFKGETDLGNGLTASGKYEWGVNAGNGGASTGGTRHGILGLSGDFGMVTLGHTYHTYYNHVNAPADIANWNSNWLGRGRTSDGISYAGEFGAVKVGLTGYFRNDADFDDDMDGTEIGASFDAGPVSIGIGVTSDSEADGLDSIEDTTGVSVSGTFGDVYLALVMQQDAHHDDNFGFGFQDDTDTIELAASFGQFYAVYASADAANADVEPSVIVLGYSLPIGRQTNAWFEYTSADSDVSGIDDIDTWEAILKYNWN